MLFEQFLYKTALSQLFKPQLSRIKNADQFYDFILSRSQYLNIRGLDDLQGFMLKRIVRGAYRNVPFYKKHFDGAEIRPSDIKGRVDLVRLPRVSKDDFRQSDLADCSAGNISR